MSRAKASSTSRVKRFRKKQAGAGKHLVSFYLSGRARDALRALSRPMTQGEIVEEAIASYIAGNVEAQKALNQSQN